MARLGRELVSEGPVIVAVLVTVMIILKQPCRIGWVRNQVCLLQLGLSHWIGGPGWRQGRECSFISVTLFEEPHQAGGSYTS